MIYKFKQNSGFSGDAQGVYQELERIRCENDDQLRPDDVVYEADDEQSPLHPHFEWDDGIAAHEYRKSTARRLMRSVVIAPEKTENNKEITPVYINVRKDGEQYYQNIESASTDEFESAIQDFKNKLSQLRYTLDQMEKVANEDWQRQKAQRLKDKTEALEETIV